MRLIPRRRAVIFLTFFFLSAAGSSAAGSGLESSRDISGEPFLEYVKKDALKAEPVRVNLTPAARNAAPLKFSEVKKHKGLGSAVGGLPQTEADFNAEAARVKAERARALQLGMDMTMAGIGIVAGGLALGTGGALVGGAIAYGVWYLATRSSR